ncbi:hypothetical protein [Thiomicrorhabdus aquaedulcis]|nr:hypothetical protein [Thiomicrorhabdus aquaedulcis]
MSFENQVLLFITLICLAIVGSFLLLGFVIDKYEEHKKQEENKPKILG